MSFKCTVIIGGGDQDLDFIASTLEKLDKESLENGGELLVIAADRGVEGLKAVGRKPDYLLGDFDSASAETVASFRDDNEGHTEVFPPEKDFTDTEAAIYKALDLGADEIWMLGMTGARLDHFLGTLHNLLIPFKAGVSAVIADPLNEIRLIGGEEEGPYSVELKKAETFGKYVSFLPLMNKAEGVTLEGFKYSLKEKDVVKGTSLCVSNEIQDDIARITIRRGIMIMVHSK